MNHPRVTGQFIGNRFVTTKATPAEAASERKRTRRLDFFQGGVSDPVVPNTQPHCFQSRCSERAVVWTLDGNGACGRHHMALARRKYVEL